MKHRRIRVGIVFGGRSGEHEVSIVSAQSVIRALNRKKFEVIPIGITKAGQWIIGSPLKALETADVKHLRRVLPPTDPSERSLLEVHRRRVEPGTPPLDVIFPVLHGTYGEDGTIQGLLELANIPYVGAGVLGSALGMDKVVQKQLYQQAGILTPPFIFFKKIDWRRQRETLLANVERFIGYPCFMKPAHTGSSVGISKVHHRQQLAKGILLAFRYDEKILIEKSIEGAHEIEISVLGNDTPKVSVPGEIIPSNEFYDYNAKYIDGTSQAIIPARLPARVTKTIQAITKKAFILLNCSGMARVDFLVTKKTHRVYLNEINTIPGFTDISMYPKLWEASGIPYGKLLEILIDLALQRQRQKNQLKTSYRPKERWYRNV